MPIVRARDVRANIKEYGFEHGVVLTLEGICEEQSGIRQHMREVVEMLDGVLNQLQVLHRFGDALKNKMDQMKRDQDGNEVC